MPAAGFGRRGNLAEKTGFSAFAVYCRMWPCLAARLEVPAVESHIFAAVVLAVVMRSDVAVE